MAQEKEGSLQTKQLEGRNLKWDGPMGKQEGLALGQL